MSTADHIRDQLSIVLTNDARLGPLSRIDLLANLVRDALTLADGYRAALERVKAAPSNGTPTSDAAARSLSPVLSSMRLRVLRTFDHHHGLRTEEVETILQGSHQSISARVNDLARLGWIAPTGRTGKNRSGRQAMIYTISSAGKRMLDAHDHDNQGTQTP